MTNQCVSCGTPLREGEPNCAACGRRLAGTREVVIEPLRQEAVVAYGLLQSAGFHPILAYLDDSGQPHPIEPEASFGDGAGLMIPVTTAFGVYVPEEEAAESIGILEDARSSDAGAGQDQADD